MFAWNYFILCHVAINKTSLIVVKGNQLLDTTIVASLAILLSSAGITHIHKLPAPEVRVMVTKAVAIKAMVMVMVVVVGRSVVRPMPCMPMSSRVMRLVSSKGINQDYLVIISIGLTRLNKKKDSRNCFL